MENVVAFEMSGSTLGVEDGTQNGGGKNMVSAEGEGRQWVGVTFGAVNKQDACQQACSWLDINSFMFV